MDQEGSISDSVDILGFGLHESRHGDGVRVVLVSQPAIESDFLAECEIHPHSIIQVCRCGPSRYHDPKGKKIVRFRRSGLLPRPLKTYPVSGVSSISYIGLAVQRNMSLYGVISASRLANIPLYL